MKDVVRGRNALVPAILIVTLLLLLFGGAPAAAAGGIHVVQRGENLSGIALRYGVSISAIMQANSIKDPNRIFFGQKLTIPSAGASGGAVVPARTATVSNGCPVHRVSLGDTLSAIALRYGVTVAGIQRANGLRNTIIWPTMRLKIPCASAPTRVLPCPLSNGRYLIRPGDTLLQIALRCSTTVASLRAANGLPSDLIRAGAWLVMPGQQRSVPQPAPTSVASPRPQPVPVPTRVEVRPLELPGSTSGGSN